MNTLVNVAIALTTLSFSIWVLLLLLWGNFWRCDQRLDEQSLPENLDRYPAVAIIIPARNEAEVIGQSVRSLLNQTYPGPLSILLVDDQSNDGTDAIVRAMARENQNQNQQPPQHSLDVLLGQPLPAGWTGKLWALKQGIAQAQSLPEPIDYILLTDADIAHDPQNLERLVAKAELEALDMASLMVQLRCESAWEKLLIPAFIFFFQKLYPFGWVNQRRRKPQRRQEAAFWCDRACSRRSAASIPCAKP